MEVIFLWKLLSYSRYIFYFCWNTEDCLNYGNCSCLTRIPSLVLLLCMFLLLLFIVRKQMHICCYFIQPTALLLRGWGKVYENIKKKQSCWIPFSKILWIQLSNVKNILHFSECRRFELDVILDLKKEANIFNELKWVFLLFQTKTYHVSP